ncbi:hypothetical protein WANA31_0605 [Wolbachia endosymbiont of Drosophila ananassae]|nr:hypothetical protein WANA31_0605 [Wolbachia endosymbiont of Drosophila ananassae]RLT63296.1 hypothetical protein WANA34_0672 [Wolbachia endosymbiont of Drosophila ananassae]
MNFVSSHQIFSVAMQQSYPSVKHWDDRKRGYLDDIFLLGINYFISQCSYSYARCCIVDEVYYL